MAALTVPTIRRYTLDRQGREQEWVPHRDGEAYYTLARPNAGHFRNLKKNAVKTPSLHEVAFLLTVGYSLRMWKGSGQINLISPRRITTTWPTAATKAAKR